MANPVSSITLTTVSNASSSKKPAKLPNSLYYVDKQSKRVFVYPFDPDQIEFSSIQHTTRGSMVRCMYRLIDPSRKLNMLVPLRLATPVMQTKFGASTPQKFQNASSSSSSSSNPNKYAITQNFDEYDPEQTLFLDAMRYFDEVTLAKAFEQRALWFVDGVRKTMEILQDYYKGVARPRISRKTSQVYSPALNSVVRIAKGELQCAIYTADKSLTTIEAVKPNSSFRSLVLHRYLFFGDKSFQHMWDCEQVQMQHDDSCSNMGFIDLDTGMIDQVPEINSASASACANGFLPPADEESQMAD